MARRLSTVPAMPADSLCAGTRIRNRSFGAAALGTGRLPDSIVNTKRYAAQSTAGTAIALTTSSRTVVTRPALRAPTHSDRAESADRRARAAQSVAPASAAGFDRSGA